MSGAMDGALAALPHGPEFRFVDRLLELEAGRSGVGEYQVPVEAEFLRGHFPGEPMLPGVVLIEAVAQLGGVVAQSDPEAGVLPGLRLTGVRAAKISGTAVPGQVVRLEARVLGRMGNLIQVSGTATVEGREVMRCEVTLAGTG